MSATVAGMANRVRITVDVPEEHRRALNMAAAERNLSAGGLIETLLDERFPDLIERARKTLAAGEAAPGKRGRRPKGD